MEDHKAIIICSVMRRLFLFIMALVYGIYIGAQNYSVGCIAGELTVSDLGSAIYSINVDIPYGDTFAPKISLSYNSSMNGYGSVGYGVDVSGISVITRGCKDLFHDKELNGDFDLNKNHAYFLDGKRLILQSGIDGEDGAIYTVEGDPYTHAKMYGDASGRTIKTWWEVVSKAGVVKRFGNQPNTRLRYYNLKNELDVASWYVCMAKDRYDNIQYDYMEHNSLIYPRQITYGDNLSKRRGNACHILFEYESLLQNARPVAIGGMRAEYGLKLSSLKVSRASNLYRKYIMTYDDSSDKSTRDFSRLVKVEVQNDEGESLPPTILNWSFLPSPDVHSEQIIDVPTSINNRFVTEGSEKSFFAADINADGISDIVRVASVILKEGAEGYDPKKGNMFTYMYISKSNVTSSGEIVYLPPYVVSLPAMSSSKDYSFILGGLSIVDFDGDGYNDLLVPYNNRNKKPDWNEETFFLISGRGIAEEVTTYNSIIRLGLKAIDGEPLLSSSDLDNDGRDDIMCLETYPVGGSHTIPMGNRVL